MIGRYALSASRVLLLLAGGALLPTGASAQLPSRDWRPDERVVIGDFRIINAVAASYDRVYAVSPRQLLIWRPGYGEWEGPFDPPDPRFLQGVTAALADPLDNSVWLARPRGWTRYEPDLRLWSAGDVSSGVQAIAFDLANPTSGLLMRTREGWLELSRGALSPVPAPAPQQPVAPPSIEAFLREHPAVAGLSGGVLSDARLRPASFTSVARSLDRMGWYLGTSGVGLFFLPEGAAVPDPLPFGVAGPSVSALFAVPGGVWAMSERTATNDATLTFLASDLSEVRYLAGPPATGLPFNTARRLIGAGQQLWAATDQGAARIEPESGRVEMFGDTRGLPDRRVFDVATRQGWLGVASESGVVRYSLDSLVPLRVAPSLDRVAYAIAMNADTTWIGTDDGLVFTTGREGELFRPGGMQGLEFAEPVIRLAWMGRSLVGLTPTRVIWRDDASQWHAGVDYENQLGRLRALTVDGDGVWLAGERGAGWARLGFPVLRPVLEGDLPGDARDVAVDEEHVWIAAEGGVVRFTREALR
jgi:ligand-binding sensor domain-containing protein